VLPGCWNVIRPEYFYFEGSCWYSRHFTYLPVARGERVFLRVGAANYDAHVFLNKRHLGNHYGGSTPFCVELTERLAGDNLIQLCVNNVRTLDRVPMRHTDWFNWGGVYRDLELFRVPLDFIKDFKIYLVPDGGYNSIAAEIEASDDKAAGEALLSIPELSIKEKIRVKNGKGKAVIDAKPELWSPARPKLYDVTLEFLDDKVSDRVGFREISVKGTDIRLNGQPLYLRGICAHEDDVVLGKATSGEDIERRFAHARELGCNFMRLAHYPHDELAARIADEIGLLLWEEIPVYWAIDFANPAVYADAENQLLELVKRDYNRASVVIWSVGNENADTEERLSFMSRLARKARQADPSRLISAACLVNHEKIKIEDRLVEHLDVIGLNEYYGWYRPHIEELETLGKNSNPDKPVIITEFGACAKAGHHGTIHDIFTEEFQLQLYEKQIETIRKLPYVKGLTPWILYDFSCPRRQSLYHRNFNRKGLIAQDKKTYKLAFYALQKFYREKEKENEFALEGADLKTDEEGKTYKNQQRWHQTAKEP
jgi:beta-glucuronidase